MMGLGSQNKQIKEANTLLALLSDPQSARKFLDEITVKIERNEQTLREAQKAFMEANQRIKEAAEVEASNQSHSQELTTLSEDLEKREYFLGDKTANFDDYSDKMNKELIDRSTALNVRDEAILQRESVIARNESQAIEHLSDAKSLEKRWLNKMARFNALAKE